LWAWNRLPAQDINVANARGEVTADIEENGDTVIVIIRRYDAAAVTVISAVIKFDVIAFANV
jgi:hypothetical protein